MTKDDILELVTGEEGPIEDGKELSDLYKKDSDYICELEHYFKVPELTPEMIESVKDHEFKFSCYIMSGFVYLNIDGKTDTSLLSLDPEFILKFCEIMKKRKEKGN